MNADLKGIAQKYMLKFFGYDHPNTELLVERTVQAINDATAEIQKELKDANAALELGQINCDAAYQDLRASLGWQKTEPPKDGTEIVAVGALIYIEEVCNVSEPFTLRVRWIKDQSGYEGWHTADGMTVARTPEDEVVIYNWIKLP